MDNAPTRPSRRTAASIGTWVAIWGLMITGVSLMTLVARTAPSPWIYVLFVFGLGLNGTAILLSQRVRRAARSTREDERL